MFESAAHITTKILSILIIFLQLRQTAALEWTPKKDFEWSCAKNASGYPLILESVSGMWYEAARMPSSTVPACVQVNVSKEITNDRLSMQLNYINNVNDKWQRTEENLTFPWNLNTQMGIFEIAYGNERVSMNFTFKLVYTDFKNVALICYYTKYAPALTMMKIMTRKEQLDERTTETLQDFADFAGLGDQLTWVEHTSSCNGALSILQSTKTWLFMLFYVLAKIF